MKIIALFGITCVGKTTIGKILSEKLGYAFIDLDAEIKKYYNDTLDNIYRDCIFPMQKDEKKSIVLSRVIAKCKSNTVLAMSPMYYYTKYRQLIKSRDIICIELRDKPEHIAKRMFVYDDNDEIIEGVFNYKENLSDAKYYISRYKNTFNRHIELKYEIDGKTALDAANDLADVLDSYTNNGILHYQYLHETKNSKYDDNVINFIIKKAIAEKSILNYLKTEYDDKVSIKKFASDIFHAHDKYLILTDEEDFICDEYDYVKERTGYSLEIIQLAVWFKECYLMKTNCFTHMGICPKCGHDDLYVRENEEELFESYLQCMKCSEEFSHEEVENHNE